MLQEQGSSLGLSTPGMKSGDTSDRGSWRKPHRTAGAMRGRLDVCSAHALSIMASLEDTQNLRDLSPWARGKAVAAFTLSPSDGVILHTPTQASSSHHDWWTEPYAFAPDNRVIDGPREV